MLRRLARMSKVDFTFNGESKDYVKIIEDVTWLLNQSLDKDLNQLHIKVSEGSESNYIKGLIVDTFSETDVNIRFL